MLFQAYIQDGKDLLTELKVESTQNLHFLPLDFLEVSVLKYQSQMLGCPPHPGI